MKDAKKHIVFVIPVMHGGGAERVATLLLNECHRRGFICEILLTSDSSDNVISHDLASEIPRFFLKDMLKASGFCYPCYAWRRSRTGGDAAT